MTQDYYNQAETTKRYGIPLTHLDYSYIRGCTDVKELENILKVLRSGDEGSFPELEKEAEQRLEALNPKSRVLRKDSPALRPSDLDKSEQENLNSELEDWRTDMKNKEEVLAPATVGKMARAHEVVFEENENLPPVRSGKVISTDGKVKEPKPKEGGKKQKVMPRSYKEWDKLDVEKELEKADEDSAPKKTGKASSFNPDGIAPQIDTKGMSDEEKRAKAIREKDKGNEAFHAHDYEESILYYTRSISIAPLAATYNNRALAYLRLSAWDDAIKDCNCVLGLEEQNIKALLRRGTALKGKKDYAKARADLDRVLGQEPNNKTAQDLLKQIGGLEKKARKEVEELKTKGRRMVIEEVNGSDEEEDEEIVVKKPDQERKPAAIVNGYSEETSPSDSSVPESAVEAESLHPNKAVEESEEMVQSTASNSRQEITNTNATKKYIWSEEEVHSMPNPELSLDRQKSEPETTNILSDHGDVSDTSINTTDLPKPAETSALASGDSDQVKPSSENARECDQNKADSSSEDTSPESGDQEDTSPEPGDQEDTSPEPGESLEPGDQEDTSPEPGESPEPGDREETSPELGDSPEHGDKKDTSPEPGDSPEHGDKKDTSPEPIDSPEYDDKKDTSPEPGDSPEHGDKKDTNPEPVEPGEREDTSTEPGDREETSPELGDRPKHGDKTDTSPEPVDSPVPGDEAKDFTSSSSCEADDAQEDAEADSGETEEAETEHARPVLVQKSLPSEEAALREKGNNFFRTGQYPDAIKVYQKIITKLQKDPDQMVNLSLILSNRAACYFKIGDCSSAISDCNTSLDLVPHAIKPLLRRAAAFETLERYGHAYVDYKHILSVDSSVDQAHQGASRCQKYLTRHYGHQWRDRLPPLKRVSHWDMPIIIEENAAGKKPITPQPLKVSSKKVNPPQEVLSSSQETGTGKPEAVKEAPKPKVPTPEEQFEATKAQGNAHVQKGEFEAAVKCYSECVKLFADRAAVLTNRALCYLKLNKAQKAEDDCTAALALEPNNCKAFYRRALARKAQKHYKDSLQDLLQLLRMEPSNTAAKKEMDVVKGLYKKEYDQLKAQTPAASDKKKHAEPQKKRKRMKIEEVDDDSDSGDKPQPATTAAPAPKSKPSGSNQKSPASTPSHSAKGTKEPIAQPSPAQSSPVPDPKHPSTRTPEARKPGRSKSKKGMTKETSQDLSVTPPSTPKLQGRITPFEFIQHWNSLKQAKDIQPYVQLLEQISPDDLPCVISSKLDGHMLQIISRCAAHDAQTGEVERAYSILRNLREVPRFSTVVMFLSSKDKQNIRKVLESSAVLGSHSAEEVAGVKKDYGLK